jgi:small-conductance mechanosensitive channel
MRPFKAGDVIKAGDVLGRVVEKSLLVTRLKTFKNEMVTIPNSTMLLGNMTNYSTNAAAGGLIVHTTVTIGYDVPWRAMHEALLVAAARCDLLLPTPAPFVLQTSLDDFYVSYQVNAHTQQAGRMPEVYSQLHQHIQDACNERGIEIMSPHYRAARDGNASTIPAEYLGKDYQAPSFGVRLNKDN